MGYYRVNYDSANWLLLTEVLHTDHTAIPALNRAQLGNRSDTSFLQCLVS